VETRFQSHLCIAACKKWFRGEMSSDSESYVVRFVPKSNCPIFGDWGDYSEQAAPTQMFFLRNYQYFFS
jgi:hypothetical protein